MCSIVCLALYLSETEDKYELVALNDTWTVWARALERGAEIPKFALESSARLTLLKKKKKPNVFIYGLHFTSSHHVGGHSHLFLTMNTSFWRTMYVIKDMCSTTKPHNGTCWDVSASHVLIYLHKTKYKMGRCNA